MAATARPRGFAAEVITAAEIPAKLALSEYAACLLVASVHTGKHECEMVEFMKAHRSELEAIRSIVISVSLSEAGAEDRARSPEMRAKSADAVRRVIDLFLADTGWHPAKVHAAAGALMYSKNNFLIRFVMRRIAHKEGGLHRHVKGSRVHPWAGLDHVIDEVM